MKHLFSRIHINAIAARIRLSQATVKRCLHQTFTGHSEESLSNRQIDNLLGIVNSLCMEKLHLAQIL